LQAYARTAPAAQKLNTNHDANDKMNHGQIILDSISQYFIMFYMRSAKTVSITLPPDLLVKAQELATREHRTMSELFREALRRYMRADAEWEGVLARTRAQGRTLGVRDEGDVERLSDEYRRDKRP
jgi:Arc/MetJ-type ribon-helix-helix transcriptional regulator